MAQRWKIWRTVLASVLIGFAEGTRMPAHRRLRRPLGIVWLDDRPAPDPLGDLPVLLLDPVVLERPDASDLRNDVMEPLRLRLPSPLRWVRRLSRESARAPSNRRVADAGWDGRPGHRWQRGQ